MKTRLLLLFFVFFWLTACQPPAGRTDLAVLQTSVAQTVAVELAARGGTIPMVTATATPTPAPTATPQPSPTPQPTATETPGPTPTASPRPRTCQGVLNAAYVTDVTIPDYFSELSPGQPFTKTWSVRNTGDCPWNDDFHLYFYSGNAMQGQPVPLGRLVAPGEEVYVSVQLQAPQQRGVHSATWQMGTADGERFGELLTVIIVLP